MAMRPKMARIRTGVDFFIVKEMKMLGFNGNLVRCHAFSTGRVLDGERDIVDARLFKDVHNAGCIVIALRAIIEDPANLLEKSRAAGTVKRDTKGLTIHLSGCATGNEARIEPRR